MCRTTSRRTTARAKLRRRPREGGLLQDRCPGADRRFLVEERVRLLLPLPPAVHRPPGGGSREVPSTSPSSNTYRDGTRATGSETSRSVSRSRSAVSGRRKSPGAAAAASRSPSAGGSRKAQPRRAPKSRSSLGRDASTSSAAKKPRRETTDYAAFVQIQLKNKFAPSWRTWPTSGGPCLTRIRPDTRPGPPGQLVRLETGLLVLQICAASADTLGIMKVAL